MKTAKLKKAIEPMNLQQFTYKNYGFTLTKDQQREAYAKWCTYIKNFKTPKNENTNR